MNRKKRVILFILFGTLLTCSTTMIILRIVGRFGSPDDDLAATMTFEVTVPSNTPETDSVFIYFNGQSSYQMDKIADFKHSITVSRSKIEPDGNLVRYRYSRNGYSFATAEYLEPDTNDFFWTRFGRETIFSDGKVQKDNVERWRWFPDEDTPIIRTTELTPDREFLPRVGNYNFRSGQVIEDLYHESFRNSFDTTAMHMKESGYTWAEIAPPWQWTEENGLPVVKNLYQKNPNYPSDKIFIEEIMAFKRVGLKVSVQPQLCCTNLNFENRSEEWWDQYFSETTRFLVHFAKISEETGVDAMHYAVGSWDVQHTQRWPQVFAEVRTHFSGDIGQMLWSFGENTGEIIPTAEEITWGEQLDYFYIAIDAPISLSENPTDQELKAGVDKMLDGTKSLFEKHGKPVVVRTTYFNAKYTWKGASFYSISDVPWQGSEEKELREGKYSLGLEDQARVVNAYFESIAERPWIIGYLQFGYGHWENPLSSELSVRGKPSEDIWKKWNSVIYEAN